VGQVVASALVVRGRTDAEAIAQRVAFLDSFSKQIHSSLDPREIADRVADIAIVWTLNRDGAPEGLYVADAIARAHGGSIDVTSRPGEQTMFVVRLPLGRDDCAQVECGP
jgi:hypothetical protein